jgi:hypothetical protein
MIWSLNGASIDVIEEEFQRLSLHTLHDATDESACAAA